MSEDRFVLPIIEDSLETVAENHQRVLSHLLDINIEKTLKEFFKASLFNNPLFPEARITETAYIMSKIYEDIDFDNLYPTNELFSRLERQLTPSVYLNISSLLNGNPHRFFKMVCFGVVTKFTELTIPFTWGGPFAFSQTYDGLIVSVAPSGIYISGQTFGPNLLPNQTTDCLVDQLNISLDVISK